MIGSTTYVMTICENTGTELTHMFPTIETLFDAYKFFHFVVQLIQIVQRLHIAKRVHLDIRPPNITVDPLTLQVTLIDIDRMCKW